MFAYIACMSSSQLHKGTNIYRKKFAAINCAKSNFTEHLH